MSDTRDPRRTTRERAAQARAEAHAAERRRQRLVTMIGAVVVLLVVGGIIGGAVIASRGSDTPAASSTGIDASAAVPRGVQGASDAFPFGVPFGAAADVPVLELFEDFQCPACADLEKAAGADVEALAASGKVRLVWRMGTFLDVNLAQTNAAAGNPDSSARALAAWGCAIDAGKTKEFHNLVYANQPADEGAGFSDAQLLGFATKAGITGTAYDTFKGCYEQRTYGPWATNSQRTFDTSGVTSTPTARLDGEALDQAVVRDKAKLAAAVAEAAKAR